MNLKKLAAKIDKVSQKQYDVFGDYMTPCEIAEWIFNFADEKLTQGKSIVKIYSLVTASKGLVLSTGHFTEWQLAQGKTLVKFLDELDNFQKKAKG